MRPTFDRKMMNEQEAIQSNLNEFLLFQPSPNSRAIGTRQDVVRGRHASCWQLVAFLKRRRLRQSLPYQP
jgi:hypothetical protein